MIIHFVLCRSFLLFAFRFKKRRFYQLVAIALVIIIVLLIVGLIVLSFKCKFFHCTTYRPKNFLLKENAFNYLERLLSLIILSIYTYIQNTYTIYFSCQMFYINKFDAFVRLISLFVIFFCS